MPLNEQVLPTYILALALLGFSAQAQKICEALRDSRETDLADVLQARINECTSASFLHEHDVASLKFEEVAWHVSNTKSVWGSSSYELQCRLCEAQCQHKLHGHRRSTVQLMLSAAEGDKPAHLDNSQRDEFQMDIAEVMPSGTDAAGDAQAQSAFHAQLSKDFQARRLRHLVVTSFRSPVVLSITSTHVSYTGNLDAGREAARAEGKGMGVWW